MKPENEKVVSGSLYASKGRQSTTVENQWGTFEFASFIRFTGADTPLCPHCNGALRDVCLAHRNNHPICPHCDKEMEQIKMIKA
ncbi:MAG TPA: hypothetical protein VHH73_03270 [Verrucomicrobiae bacterium]|nr:hypothetical protein [Verrucomicrobiae bacterium]